MYNLFDKYEYVGDVVDALEPRMALPCSETRAFSAAVVVAVRARTLRVCVVAARERAASARETTRRFAVSVVRGDVVVVRDAVARGVTERADAAVRDAGVVVAVVRGFVAVRAIVRRDVAFDEDVARGLVRPGARAAAGADCGAMIVVVSTGAIGSANVERIDINVEHTKNAPASKNIVPRAFLKESLIF